MVGRVDKLFRRFVTREDGITLTEMMIVLALLGMVLGTAYMAQQAIMKSNDIAERQAALTQQITYPMLLLEKIIIQNRELRTATDYQLVCTTDKNLDGVYELNTVLATTDGRIMLRVQLLNNDGTIQSLVSQNYIGQNNTNVSSGTPMFKYLMIDHGAVVEVPADQRADKTQFVDMTIRATYKQATLEESRTIQFRNRDF